jgi:hypothetical protein
MNRSQPQLSTRILPRLRWVRARAKDSGRKMLTADYCIWLVNVKGLRPAYVPLRFSTRHLDQLPLDERRRWLKTARRRYLARKKAAA